MYKKMLVACLLLALPELARAADGQWVLEGRVATSFLFADDTPKNQHSWLVLAEVLVPLVVQRHVRRVVVKGIQLDVVVAWAVQEVLVEGPSARA